MYRLRSNIRNIYVYNVLRKQRNDRVLARRSCAKSPSEPKKYFLIISLPSTLNGSCQISPTSQSKTIVTSFGDDGQIFVGATTKYIKQRININGWTEFEKREIERKEHWKIYLHDVSSVSVLVERISVHRMLKSCVRTWNKRRTFVRKENCRINAITNPLNFIIKCFCQHVVLITQERFLLV